MYELPSGAKHTVAPLRFARVTPCVRFSRISESGPAIAVFPGFLTVAVCDHVLVVELYVSVPKLIVPSLVTAEAQGKLATYIPSSYQYGPPSALNTTRPPLIPPVPVGETVVAHPTA